MAEVCKDPSLEIYKILSEARANAKKEMRDEVRYPFFRPVTIDIGEIRVSGFSREVSERGIGLLHNTVLALGEVKVTISIKEGSFAQVRTKIGWCNPCGEGWYISGGTFVGIPRVGVPMTEPRSSWRWFVKTVHGIPTNRDRSFVQ